MTADLLLSRWGRLKADEIEDEVGLPRLSPSCAGYNTPPSWVSEGPPSGVTAADVEKTVLAMVLLSRERWDTYVLLRDFYRDGVAVSRDRLERAQSRFLAEWRGMGEENFDER